MFLNSYNKCICCTVDSCTVSKGLKHWHYKKVVVIYFYFISNFRENMDNQLSLRYVYISLSLSLNAPPPLHVDQHFVWHLSKSNNNIKCFAHYIYLSFCKGVPSPHQEPSVIMPFRIHVSWGLRDFILVIHMLSIAHRPNLQNLKLKKGGWL